MASSIDASAYYRNLYPYELVYDWQNFDASGDSYRELAICDEQDRWYRFLAFKSVHGFKRAIFNKETAFFHIGAIYSSKNMVVSLHYLYDKTLVIWLDITDYPKRTCCGDKKDLCSQCWGFILIAIKFLDDALRVDFKFKHLLWVYSGRKGVHVWVSDARAMAMTDRTRLAVVNELSGLQRSSGIEYPKWRLTLEKNATPLAKKTAPMKPTYKYVIFFLTWLFSQIFTEEPTTSSRPTLRYSCLNNRGYLMEMVL